MYRIYISTFGKPVLKLKDSVAIEVGACNRKTLYPLKDNSGDNISSENVYYGELTGLYWIWKNARIADDDIVGYAHYNKALGIKRKNVEKWLSCNPTGMISLAPTKNRDHPNAREVHCMLETLKSKYPDCYAVWNKLYDEEAAGRSEVCRGGNMFIAKGATFNAYCSWLFDVLGTLRSMVGESSYSEANMKRYCAFMGERLLSVYIETYQIPVLGVEIKYKEWWLPYIRKAVKIFHINTNSTYYKLLKKHFGYSSQYGRKE